MEKLVCIILIVCSMAGGVFAQTSNLKYQVTSFAEPPDGPDWGDTVSVAADGKGAEGPKMASQQSKRPRSPSRKVVLAGRMDTNRHRHRIPLPGLSRRPDPYPIYFSGFGPSVLNASKNE